MKRHMTSARKVVLRDLLIFQVKLALDGIKDIVLMPVSIGAAAIDFIFAGRQNGRFFYAVMRAGEGFDRWLSLYAPAQRATTSEDGLFGASRAGSDTLLGEIEAIVLGHDEPRGAPPRR